MSANSNHTGEANKPEASDPSQEASSWPTPSYPYECGIEAVCELGNALAGLRALESCRNEVLSGERATQHREAIERAILDLAVGLGAQRMEVQLGVGSLGEG